MGRAILSTVMFCGTLCIYKLQITVADFDYIPFAHSSYKTETNILHISHYRVTHKEWDIKDDLKLLKYDDSKGKLSLLLCKYCFLMT